MKPVQTTPKRERRLDERPPQRQADGKLPFEGSGDEEASKTGFPGQADQRSTHDKDGNDEQARKRRARPSPS